MTAEIKNIKQEKDSLYDGLQLSRSAKIVCRKNAHSGVQIIIANLNFELLEERSTGIFGVEKQKITFKSGLRF